MARVFRIADASTLWVPVLASFAGAGSWLTVPWNVRLMACLHGPVPCLIYA